MVRGVPRASLAWNHVDGATDRYLSIEANLDALMRMREQLKAAGTKVSVNDCVIKAAAMALVEVPEANASWNEVRPVSTCHLNPQHLIFTQLPPQSTGHCSSAGQGHGGG
jgi:hypothetical protein